MFLQSPADLCTFHISQIKGNDPIVRCIHQTAGTFEIWHHIQSLLDLLKFDPMPHVFDLKILTPTEIEQSFLIKISQISRAIKTLSLRQNLSCYVGWQLLFFQITELLSCLQFIVIITVGKGLPAYTDLPLSPGFCDEPMMLIQKKDASSVKCLSDRQFFTLGHRMVDDVIGAVTGDLRWSVEIDKHSVRQSLLPEF